MELRQLRYVVALAEELHFGRAAHRLGLTQPSLSQAIQNLERELGVRLFDRTRRRVALTHAGATFVEEARVTLAHAAEAVEHARRADRGEVGRLAVGFLPATTYTLLPLILRDFKARFAGVRLDLRELSRPQQLDALRRDGIQVGLLRPPVSEAELASPRANRANRAACYGSGLATRAISGGIAYATRCGSHRDLGCSRFARFDRGERRQVRLGARRPVGRARRP
jgi:DNA-binding transcriptional LysR family regulator